MERSRGFLAVPLGWATDAPPPARLTPRRQDTATGSGTASGGASSMRFSTPLRARHRSLLAVVLLAMLSASPGTADIYSWDVGDGAFETPSSWAPSGPPGSSDGALFSGGGAHTVSFASGPQNSYAEVLDGTYVFELNGHTYNLTASRSMTVGLTGGRGPTLVLSGGHPVGQVRLPRLPGHRPWHGDGGRLRLDVEEFREPLCGP
jgi:hypothetical protein